MIEITNVELTRLMSEASEIGAQKALVAVGALSPNISKQEAYKLYGRTDVDRWIKEGHLVANKDGNHSAKCRIDRVKIAELSKKSNRHTYLMVSERK